MEPQQRIEELEQRLRELTAEVARLREHETNTAAAAPTETALAHFVDDVREGVDRAIGGERGESLETRIGGIWLGRAAVLVMMTTIGLGAASTLGSGVIGPARKVALVYLLSAIAVGYGLLPRNRRDPFAMTVLGAGLAGLYFTTYAAFFIEGMRVFMNPIYALPALAACLAVLIGVAHRRRSQTAAGIALFLVIYTVLFSCTHAHRVEDLLYALGTCAVLSIVALGFHVAHRWMAFTWVSLVATYLTYILFFMQRPATLDITPEAYFWWSNGFLTLCYAMFAAISIVDVRTAGCRRRFGAPLAALNAVLYVALTYGPIQALHPDYEWRFRAGLAAFALVLSFLAETAGSQRNTLYRVYVIMAAVMAALAIQSALSGAAMWVALATMCFVLAVGSLRTGIVAFKALNMALMIVVVFGCLFTVKSGATLHFVGLAVRANWFCALGVGALFALIACAYERFGRRLRPEQRRRSGHWFLADTFLDLPGTLASLAHATAAGLVLLAITLVEHADDSALPYLLAAECLALMATGVVLATPQLRAASVVLLVGAHVAYHFYLFIGRVGFEEQYGYTVYTLLLVSFTFLSAYYWERYLERLPGRDAWDHHLTASIPYLMGTYMLATVTTHALDWVYTPIVYNLIGVALLVLGALVALTGLKASGVLLLALGAVQFQWNMGRFESVLNVPGDFPLYGFILVLTYLLGERLLCLMRARVGATAQAEDAIRTLLVAAAAELGVAALGAWADAKFLTLFLLVQAFVAMLLGALFREPRYRWAALCVFAVTLMRAYRFDLVRLDPVWQVLSFAGLAVALLVISWVYSRYRLRRLHKKNDAATTPPAADVS